MPEGILHREAVDTVDNQGIQLVFAVGHGSLRMGELENEGVAFSRDQGHVQ
jgi:hypothetical protein